MTDIIKKNKKGKKSEKNSMKEKAKRKRREGLGPSKDQTHLMCFSGTRKVVRTPTRLFEVVL